MAEAAIHLVDELLPLVPVRQFVVTFPVQLRLWMARSKSLCAKVCEKVCAELTAHLQRATGIEKGLSGLDAWPRTLAVCRFCPMYLGMGGDLGGLHFQKANSSKSTDTARRKGGAERADRGGFFGRIRCAVGLILPTHPVRANMNKK
jgi:hypothetical protein